MNYRSFARLMLVLWIICATSVVQAQGKPRIGELSNVDQKYMAQQRAMLDDIAASEVGRRFSGNRDRDLDLLQTMLDRQLVGPDQTRQLQAMGVVMGDLLAADLDMHWVIYEDRVGRSRALRYQLSDEYLFPITMISRRREVDNQTPVAEIYRKAYDIIADRKPPLPFQ